MKPHHSPRTSTALIAAMLFALGTAGAAQAACFADYKAKRDDPLKLHYGVAEVSDAACSKQGAAKVLAPRLAGDGWVLLNVLSVFGPDKLDEVKSSAGDYFLRY